MKNWAVPLGLGSVLGLTGCATSFTGSAYYNGGAAGCFQACEKQQMVMTAFVYSGEFSTSCVCRPREMSASATSSPRATEATEAGTAAAVGVALQMRQQQAEQQRRARRSGWR